jgi:hypothetical protein
MAGRSKVSQTECEGCGENVPSYDITHSGSIELGYRKLCSRCFSAEVAKHSGVDDFDHARLEPIEIVDCNGEVHQFHFVSRLLGHIVTLDAFELKDGQQSGYEFQIIGDPEEDQFALLGRMVSRIRKTLSVKYITDEGDGHGFQIADMKVHGRIGCDTSEDFYTPCVIIDGKEISWGEFGRMLSSLEGCQFKLEIFDRSDEL